MISKCHSQTTPTSKQKQTGLTNVLAPYADIKPAIPTESANL